MPHLQSQTAQHIHRFRGLDRQAMVLLLEDAQGGLVTPVNRYGVLL